MSKSKESSRNIPKTPVSMHCTSGGCKMEVTTIEQFYDVARRISRNDDAIQNAAIYIFGKLQEGRSFTESYIRQLVVNHVRMVKRADKNYAHKMDIYKQETDRSDECGRKVNEKFDEEQAYSEQI